MIQTAVVRGAEYRLDRTKVGRFTLHIYKQLPKLLDDASQ